MVLPLMIALAAAPGLLGTQEAVHQSQKKERREEHRARRCNLVAQCIQASSRSEQIDGRQIVLRNNKLFVDAPTSDGSPLGHPFAGYYLPYPDQEYEGLVSTIAEDPPILRWIYMDKETQEVKYGVRAEAQPNLNGPFDCTRQDRRLTLEGWEGFCAVEEQANLWAIYFDRNDNALKDKLSPGTRVLEIELTRVEKKFKKDPDTRKTEQATLHTDEEVNSANNDSNDGPDGGSNNVPISDPSSEKSGQDAPNDTPDVAHNDGPSVTGHTGNDVADLAEDDSREQKQPAHIISAEIDIAPQPSDSGHTGDLSINAETAINLPSGSKPTESSQPEVSPPPSSNGSGLMRVSSHAKDMGLGQELEPSIPLMRVASRYHSISGAPSTSEECSQWSPQSSIKKSPNLDSLSSRPSTEEYRRHSKFRLSSSLRRARVGSISSSSPPRYRRYSADISTSRTPLSRWNIAPRASLPQTQPAVPQSPTGTTDRNKQATQREDRGEHRHTRYTEDFNEAASMEKFGMVTRVMSFMKPKRRAKTFSASSPKHVNMDEPWTWKHALLRDPSKKKHHSCPKPTPKHLIMHFEDPSLLTDVCSESAALKSFLQLSSKAALVKRDSAGQSLRRTTQ